MSFQPSHGISVGAFAVRPRSVASPMSVPTIVELVGHITARNQRWTAKFLANRFGALAIAVDFFPAFASASWGQHTP
jgi:hypothetical protein